MWWTVLLVISMIFENHRQVIVEKCVLKKTIWSVIIINIYLTLLAWAYRIKCEKDGIMVELTKRKWQLLRHIIIEKGDWQNHEGSYVLDARWEKVGGRPRNPGYGLNNPGLSLSLIEWGPKGSTGLCQISCQNIVEALCVVWHDKDNDD